MNRYLFVSAHTDDSELSCGGTMAKLVEEGHSVVCLALSYCDKEELLVEYANASQILGVRYWNESFDVRCLNQQSVFIADALLKYRNFDYVFTHSEDCKHPDHRTVAQECRRVFNNNLLTYIQPWNGSHEENYFVELSESQLETKIKALECYKSQAHRAYMHPDFIRAQARYNGIKCGKLYAEGFKVVRLVQ